MISMWTDDPVKDAERYAQEQEEEMMENSLCVASVVSI